MSGLQTALVLGGALTFRPDVLSSAPYIGVVEVGRTGEWAGSVLRIQSSDPAELTRLADALTAAADSLRHANSSEVAG